MKRTYAIAAVAAAIAGTAGVWLTTSLLAQRSGSQDCPTAQVAGASIGGPFTLVNAQGHTVTDRDVITRPSLIYFGYTFCPDVCPLDTARNAEAVDLLAERGIEVTPIFISIDPARDTPEVVGEFAENLHEKMIGLTGSPEQVKAASTAYKTYYQAQPGDDEFYLVNHSTHSYLVLPDTGFVAFFRRDEPPEAVAERVACFAA